MIGGGAAGIFCAVNLARMDPSAEVMVLEKTGKLLSKVKVSGGGRCNVTHACYDIAEMIAHYPRGAHFLKKAFHKWFTTDTIAWFAERGVGLKAEEDGRMFPVTDSSQTIIDCLMKEVNKYGVEIRMKAEVVNLEVLVGQVEEAAGSGEATGEAVVVGTVGTAGVGGRRFRVHLADERILEADAVCIACGGYPKTGMFEWVRQLGHAIEEPVPSLFTFNMPGHPITRLMGVTVPDVRVRIAEIAGIVGVAGITGSGAGRAAKALEQRGPILITHWGMSGPVILRLSAWGARELAGGSGAGADGSAAGGYRFTILVNWVPEFSERGLREKMQTLRYELAGQKMITRNPFGLPQRLWEYLLAGCGIADTLRWADLPVREQNKLIRDLCAGEFAIKGKTVFKEEFVTAGGVKLAEVDPATMRSRKMPGLFFAGEILDVDGVTGGFNFQHAWSSGWIAAEAMAGLGR